MTLQGKRVIVTGGHKRLGRALALALAEAGADVAITWRSDKQAADDTVLALQARGVRAMAVRAELTDSSQLSFALAEMTGWLGGLDLLVASAASWRPTPVNAWTAAALDQVLLENARAPVDLLLQAVPWLQQSSDGRAVLIGDLAGITPFSGYLAHSMAKAALHAAVRGLAVELAPAVLVNGIAPGAVLQPEDLGDGAWRALQSRVPHGETALRDPTVPVAAVCEAALWLATCPRFVAGQIVPVDGGRTARW